MADTKRCSKCGKTKSRDEFYKRSSIKSGLTSQCKKCCRVAEVARAAKDPDYYKHKYAQQTAKDPHYEVKRKLKIRYGMTVEQYNQMFENQGGLCVICDGPETVTTVQGAVCSLSVDHDHNTGEVRGLLCRACNTAIGLLKNDPAILTKAIRYLL